jgi:FkbM family methyltransferase
MIIHLKRIVAKLPLSVQQELKRWFFYWKIVTGRFQADEPEWEILDKFVSKGDWVIDIGANIGTYTVELSKIVGPYGRVIAIEPVPESFYLLTTNTSHCKNKNITLLNAAISDCNYCAGFEIPKFNTGLVNYYQAHISHKLNIDLKVMCLSIDSMNIPKKISLVKIDAEDHELNIIRGMQELIKKDKPTIIVEGKNFDISRILENIGYEKTNLHGSPNTLFFFK